MVTLHSPGTTEDATPLLAGAIERAAARGGGTVFLGPGEYRCGTVHLKSDVTLHVGPGARIVGSTRFEDYAPDGLRRDRPPAVPRAEGAILYGEDLHNVAVVGEGEIDGSGEAFWGPRGAGHHRIPRDLRPHAVVQFLRCSRVTLRGLNLCNAPCYTVWLLGCDSVRISELRIRNPTWGPNTDGLDIDGCSNVTIRDCDIAAGDDCIALKSDSYRLGSDGHCTNITVANCVLSSPTCGVRIGFEGDGDIRNACFSNLAMYRTRHGIDILSIVTCERAYTEMRRGAAIRNIAFSNITMESTQKAFYIWQGPGNDRRDEDLKGGISDLAFSNIVAEVSNGSFIGGLTSNPVRNLSFEHVRCRFTGDAPAPTPLPPPVFGGNSRFPHAFTLRNTEAVSFHAVCNDVGPYRGWMGDVLRV